MLITLNMMKLIYSIYVCLKKFPIMYNINTTSILHTGSHKSFPILCGNSLKCILLYLYCINYNEINICDWGIQNHVSHEKWLKLYKYFLYRLTQKVSNTLRPMAWGFIKRILAYLYRTKYDEINIYHLCMHKNVFHNA